DVDRFLDAFPEYELTDKQREDWYRDRQAIIIGKATAGQLGWKEGDRVTILPSLPPYTPMEFHIVALSPPQATDKITNFCRRDYLEEERRKQHYLDGIVSFIFVKCNTRADLDEFRSRIDQQFTGGLDETKTQDEKAFMNEFINQQFNLPRNL